MNELVYIDPTKVGAIPFTTSEVIAEYAGARHDTIQHLLRDHKADFEEFGIIGFEIRKLNGRGRPEILYRLNEEQATLLLTYLRNTPQVREFKKRLVKAFYTMRRELSKIEVTRAAMKPVRREMTDAISDYFPPSPHKAMYYKHFYDSVYKRVLGMNAAQLRRSRGAPPDANASDYLTSDEMKEIIRTSGWVSVLVEMGYEYPAIKSLLFHNDLTQIEEKEANSTCQSW